MARYLIIALLLILPSSQCPGDVIHLKTGGRVDGKILEKTDQAVKIRTQAGEVSVDRNRIEHIEYKALPIEDYHKELKQLTDDDIQGHYALGMWCKDNRLRKEAEERFRYVLKLNPEHKDARRQLGYRRYRGRWMTSDEVMIAQGKVRYGSEWVTPKEAEHLAALEKQQAISKRLSRLAQAIEQGSRKSRERAMDALAATRDPDAVKPLGRFAESKHVGVRRGVINALTGIGTCPAADELAKIVLIDPEEELRVLALAGLKKIKGIDASEYYISALSVYRKKPVELKEHAVLKRRVLTRGAWALGEIGDKRAIPTLISVLVVDMGYSVTRTQPRSVKGPTTIKSHEISPHGQPTGRTHQARLLQPSVGAVKTETETVIFINEEAHEALRKLTGEDFGFEKTPWGEWWLMNKPIFGPENPFDE